MEYSKEEQEKMAAIVRREILIIDAYNAVQNGKQSSPILGVTENCDLWVLLETLTNEELTEIIKQNNYHYETSSKA